MTPLPACEFCFGDQHRIEDYPDSDLIVARGRHGRVIHRIKQTGQVTSNGLNQSPLNEMLSDPDFGFEDLPEAGGAD